MEKIILQQLIDFGNYKNDSSKSYLSKTFKEEDVEIFFSIILSAFCADGKLEEDEIDEFANIIGNSKLCMENFSKNGDDFDKYLDRYNEEYNNGKFNKALEYDTTIINDELKLTVFCKCCDIILSKPNLKNADIYYIDELRKLLDIYYEKSQEIIEIFIIKNKY